MLQGRRISGIDKAATFIPPYETETVCEHSELPGGLPVIGSCPVEGLSTKSGWSSRRGYLKFSVMIMLMRYKLERVNLKCYNLYPEGLDCKAVRRRGAINGRGTKVAQGPGG